MTDAEWDACEDPGRMLDALRYEPWDKGEPRYRVSDRKLRLWVAALSRLSRYNYDPHNRWLRHWDRGEKSTTDDSSDPIVSAEDWCDRYSDQLGDPPMPVRAAILRDLVGNPFRPHAVLPRDIGGVVWRGATHYRQENVILEGWLTPQVVTLGQAAYGDRQVDGTLDYVTLLALADALEEEGCDSVELLAHLRSPGPHYRGCWAVDLLLGKS